MSAEQMHAWIEKTLAQIQTNTDHISELIVGLGTLRDRITDLTELVDINQKQIARLEIAVALIAPR